MEIDDFRIQLKNDINEIRNDQKYIKTQVEKTNGRVTKLELWKSGLVGAISVIMFLVVAMIIPIMVRVISSFINGG